MADMVSVDDSNLKRKIRTITNRIDASGKATTSDIAKLGMNYIQFYMPKDTGESAKSIGWQETINTKGYHEARIIQIFMPHPLTAKWNNMWFNIPWYMFDGKYAEEHYRSSGSISNMRDVISVLRKEFYRRIELELNKDVNR